MTELYRHFDADGKLLYVGISEDTFHRLKQHMGGSRWAKEVTAILVERFDTRAEAMLAEREAIATENPTHNLKRPVAPKPEPIVLSEDQQQILRRGLRMSHMRAYQAWLARGKVGKPPTMTRVSKVYSAPRKVAVAETLENVSIPKIGGTRKKIIDLSKAYLNRSGG